MAQTNTELLGDVVEGLSGSPKTLPCKYFYDELGSEIFEKITDTEEYYPTVTELGIMKKFEKEISDEIGENGLIVELGSGSGRKTKELIASLSKPVSFFLPLGLGFNVL